MPDTMPQAEIRLGKQGRLVIPAPLQRVLGLEPGDALVVRLEDGRLTLEKANVIKHRLKARFVKLPAGVSLADELVAERQREARREDRADNPGLL